jgi:RNA polymerase sigma-70 factor (ECF subfamily)
MLTADSPAARPVASLARSRTAPIEPVSVAVSPPSDGKSPTPAPQNVAVREAAAIHEEEYAARPDFFRYNQLLLEHIRPFHRYPDAARGRAVQGVVLIGFLMRRDGVVPEAWVETSSGSGDLDTAALATIRQAQPFSAHSGRPARFADDDDPPVLYAGGIGAAAMTDGGKSRLRDLLGRRYGYLLSRLTAKVGSRDLAHDVLHDAFVRLERAHVAEEVREPTSYLLQMATNIARNRVRRDGRLPGIDEMRALLDVEDEDQNPARDSEHASEMRAVEQAMRALTPRRRILLTQAWLEERATAELAVEHGISIRMVQLEIKAAMEEIRRTVAAPNVIPFRRDDRKVS